MHRTTVSPHKLPPQTGILRHGARAGSNHTCALGIKALTCRFLERASATTATSITAQTRPVAISASAGIEIVFLSLFHAHGVLGDGLGLGVGSGRAACESRRTAARARVNIKRENTEEDTVRTYTDMRTSTAVYEIGLCTAAWHLRRFLELGHRLAAALDPSAKALLVHLAPPR